MNTLNIITNMDTQREAQAKVDQHLPEYKIVVDPKNCFATPTRQFKDEMMYGTKDYSDRNWKSAPKESIAGKISYMQMYDVAQEELDIFPYPVRKVRTKFQPLVIINIQS